MRRRHWPKCGDLFNFILKLMNAIALLLSTLLLTSFFTAQEIAKRTNFRALSATSSFLRYYGKE